MKVIGTLNPALKTNDRKSVRGIIKNPDGKLITVTSERYNDCYFPGGGEESGESETETLLREVRGETGVEIDTASIKEFERVDLYFDDKFEKNAEFHQINMYYLCSGEKISSRRRRKTRRKSAPPS